jgi:hypothetical protein
VRSDEVSRIRVGLWGRACCASIHERLPLDKYIQEAGSSADLVVEVEGQLVTVQVQVLVHVPHA